MPQGPHRPRQLMPRRRASTTDPPQRMDRAGQSHSSLLSIVGPPEIAICGKRGVTSKSSFLKAEAGPAGEPLMRAIDRTRSLSARGFGQLFNRERFPHRDFETRYSGGPPPTSCQDLRAQSKSTSRSGLATSKESSDSMVTGARGFDGIFRMRSPDVYRSSLRSYWRGRHREENPADVDQRVCESGKGDDCRPLLIPGTSAGTSGRSVDRKYLR